MAKNSLNDADSFDDCQPSLSNLKIVKGVRSLKQASESVNYCYKRAKSLCRRHPSSLVGGGDHLCPHLCPVHSRRDHVCQNNHIMDWEASEIVKQEGDKFKRWIKESVCIRSNTPTMNRGTGSLSAFPHMDTSDLHSVSLGASCINLNSQCSPTPCFKIVPGFRFGN